MTDTEKTTSLYDNINRHGTGDVLDPVSGHRRREMAHPDLARWWAIVQWGREHTALVRRAKVYRSREEAEAVISAAEDEQSARGLPWNPSVIRINGYRTRAQAGRADISHALEQAGRMW